MTGGRRVGVVGGVWTHRVLLVLVVLTAFSLRAWNINWDQDQHLHPDERYWSFVTDDISAPTSVADYFDSQSTAANPYNRGGSWVYGTVPILLNKAVASWLADGVSDGSFPADTVAGAIDRAGIDLVADGEPTFDSDFDSHVPGRLLAALFDTGTVVLGYLVARRLFDRSTGLIAAVFLATTVLHIQYSHMFTAETMATFFVTLTVLLSLRLAGGDTRLRTIVAVGSALGLAVAVKLNGVVAVPAVVVAAMLSGRPLVFAAPAGRLGPSDVARRMVGPAQTLLATALVAVLAFRVALPYAFVGGFSLRLDERFIDDITRLAEIQRGEVVFPPSVQWIGRVRLLYPLEQMVRWGLGPPLTVAAVVGAVVVAATVRRRGWRSSPAIDLAVPGALIVAMVVVISTQRTPTMRYLLPIYPMLAVLGAHGVVTLWRRRPVRAWTSAAIGPERVFAGLVVVLAVLWGWAFTAGVYGRDHSRIAATEWMADNVPAGSAVSSQLWDDTVPLRLPSTAGYGVEVVQLRPFDTDSPAKVTALVDGLDEVDYVIESSNRLYGSIPRVPAQYPATVRYYDALFDGRLGFEQVAEFANAPALFGVTIDDAGAEEAFTVYDHPTVTIWAKTDRYDRDRALALIGVDRAGSAISVLPGDADENALMLRPDAYRTQQQGGTFTDVFGDGTGLTSTWPWLWWFLFLQVAAFAALPWVTWVFGRSAGAGYAFTKPLGLLAIAVPVWLLVSWRVVDFGRGVVWSVVAALVAGGVVGARRRWPALLLQYRDHRRAWVTAELVFVVAFFAMVLLRAANPDLWHPFRGGEKPMELAYLTAVTRSTTFPPYDPWFAGGSMNYFYFGFAVLAMPIRALKILPEVAFNLGVATFGAFAAVVGFGIVHALRGGTQRPGALHTRVRAGVLGAVLVVVAGNLAAFRQQVVRLRWVDQWSAAGDLPVVGPVFEVLGGLWYWLRGGGLPVFDWWAPSRVNEGTSDITEFPAWSFVFGDLHPHVMGLTVLGLVLATAVTYVQTASPSTEAVSRKPILAAAVLLGALTGISRMLNTWDLPVAVLVTVGAVVLGQVAGGRTLNGTAARIARDLAVAGTVHLALTWPYVRATRVADDGLSRTPVTTPFDSFVTQFGVFTVIALAYLAVRMALLPRAEPPPVRRAPERDLAWFLVPGAGVVLLVGMTRTAGVVGALAAVCSYGFLVLAAFERRRGPVTRTFVACLFALGFAIVAGVEVVAVDNDIERLNTIFKFWFQAWLVLAVGAAFAVFDMLDGLREAGRDGRPALLSARAALATAIAMLVAATLVFAPLAIPERVDDRFATLPLQLDGSAFIEGAVLSTAAGPVELAEDLPLIDWLRDNVDGSPTIVEAIGPSYQWAGRISIHTGLPAVIGWESHQIQQRREFAGAVSARRTETAAFWQTPDPEAVAAFLRRYDVTFVVVGGEERRTMAPGMDEVLASVPWLDAVFDDGPDVIYEVDKWAIRGLEPAVDLGPLVVAAPR